VAFRIAFVVNLCLLTHPSQVLPFTHSARLNKTISVLIATRIRAGIGVRFSVGGDNFSLYVHLIQMGCRTNKGPGIKDTWTILPAVKQLECEADQLFSSSSKVNNAWSYTSNLSYIFMEWCLIRYVYNHIYQGRLIINKKTNSA
jgi:hypothetical protein